MKENMITLELRRPKTRMGLRLERRWRMVENVLNVLLGLGSVAAAFYGGWLVGSGAFW